MTANGRLKPELLSQDLIFGSAPILEGENPEAYDELLAQVSSAVNPSDTIERIWISGYRRSHLGAIALASDQKQYDGRSTNKNTCR